MVSAASLAPAQSSSQKTMLLRKLVAKINFATLSPGSSSHAPDASLSVQKTFAIPAGVATFHSNQLLSAFQLENHHAINRVNLYHLNFSNSIYRKSLKKATLLRG
ncbi:hypothetical protein AN959_10550 [Psychrobacillus sp. FJAT-21963]|nr:hypothetical protein AN959_10550 [Psychrobacillus sp. FJAT-21963]